MSAIFVAPGMREGIRAVNTPELTASEMKDVRGLFKAGKVEISFPATHNISEGLKWQKQHAYNGAIPP